jgi:hypothetical protein
VSDNPFLDMAGVKAPPPTAPAGAAPGGAAPVAERNNNPGNLRWDGKSQWQGMVGVDPQGFVIFDSPENGARALSINLGNQARLHGLDTVRGIITKFAPPSDGNDTDGYVSRVAKQLGVGPDDKIDPNDPRINQAMQSVIVPTEAGGGMPASSSRAAASNPFLEMAQGGTPVGDAGADNLGPQGRGGRGGDGLPGGDSLRPVVRVAPPAGQEQTLGDFARDVGEGTHDLTIGAVRGVNDVLGTGAWAADKLGFYSGLWNQPKLGDLVTGDHAGPLQSHTDQWDKSLAGHQYDPEGWGSQFGRIAGGVAVTWPVAEVRAASKIPALARAIEATRAAEAAGEAAPAGMRAAAAAGRYGDMAAQGGIVGAATSGGHNVGEKALAGALIAPVAGKAIDVIAPRAVAAYEKVAGSKLAQALKARMGKGGAAAADDAGAAFPAPEGWTAEEAAQGWRHGANGELEFAPEAAPRKGWDVKIDVARPGEAFPDDTGNASPGVAPSSADLAKAMGSAGSRSGISAITDLPPQVQQHVAELTAQGVPPAQALAEADIRYIGGQPTVANVTRDRAEQQAMFEGAKQDTPEGRALAARIADNNAAVHGSAQDTVANYGGIPAQGEAAEAAAQSLAKASDAERAKVSRLYDVAALEHGHTQPQAIEPDINAPVVQAPHPWDQRPKVDVPDERDVLSSYKATNAYGKKVNRKGPMDLVSWLRATGGLQDQGSELSHYGITNKPRDLDFARNEGFLGPLISPSGKTLDDAAHDAWEAGFFPHLQERPTVSDFIDAVADTHRGYGGGGRIFHPEDWEELERFEQTRDARYEAEQRAGDHIVDEHHASPTLADLDRNAVPDAAYTDELAKMGGTVSAKPLYAALEDTAFKAPLTTEGRSLASGFRQALDALTDGGKKPLPPSELERLRKMVNSAYNPMGGEANALGGKLKGKIDELFDELGEASPAYKAARAAHKAWASKYDNPAGVARLIRRDAAGNFMHADNWRQAENGLIGTLSDRDFAQVVRQLRTNGDEAALDRIKASVVQRAYERSSAGARDERGNSILNGKRFQDELDKIGMAKLRALFTKGEIAHLAAIGRAARALNEAVPGTVNTSNTSSALVRALADRGDKVGAKKKLLLKALGHAVAGVTHPGIGNVAVHFAGEGMERGAAARSSKRVAEALRQTMDPASARASTRAAEQRLADSIRRRRVAHDISKWTPPLSGSAQQKRRK